VIPGKGDRTPGGRQTGVQLEAILALTSLGYSRQAAEKAVHAATAGPNGKEFTVEEIIKTVLRVTGRQ
jgi:Holliday junction resolvasome RuvABC DNA-binding subunit